MRTLLCIACLAALLCAAVPAIELDQAPAKAGQWGYRPADGATASLNPPAFTWRPVEEAAAYVLQVARNGDFEDLACEVRSPWPAHAPDTKLPPGEYGWRYLALDDKGVESGWSTVRRFSVSGDARVFPKPAPGEQAARIPKAHPRLFMRPDDLERFRTLAEGELASTWEGIRKTADKYLDDPPDTSEPPKYPKGTEYKSEQWKKIWWGNRKRAVAASNAAATLGFAWQISREERYAAAGRDILLAVMDWDPKGSTNYRYNDEAAMPLLYYPSRAYTWLHDYLTEDERAKVREVMAVRGGDCFNHLRGRNHLWRPYASHSNRAWHWLGEVSIAFYGETPEAAEWLDYALTIFYTCYPVWGGKDGGWHEGMAYWRSYISRFMYWASVSEAALDVNVFNKPFFHQTGYYAMYTLPPGTQAGAFSDHAQRVSAKGAAGLMAQLAAGAQNPHWQWYAESQGASLPDGYYGFVARANSRELEPRKPTDLPASRVFQDTGLAVLNTDLLDGTQNVQVHFKSSPWGRQSHGYNANNTFLLHLNGERAFIKSGQRDVYGSPHHKQWMFETKSDNAILVNGEGQDVHTATATGRITAFETNPQFDFVAGEAGDSYDNLDRWTRRILFFKPSAVLIHDVLAAPEPSTFQWLLHTKDTPFTLGDNSARWEGGPGTVDVHFLAPARLAITQKDEFDTPPHDWASFTLTEFHLAAATEKPAANQEFLTLLVIDDADVEAARTESGVDLRIGDNTYNITLTPGRITMSGPKVNFANP
ncbi:MAG: DUF4962 domain-containing protein [Candidatus Hydrogenedentota bacterium]